MLPVKKLCRVTIGAAIGFSVMFTAMHASAHCDTYAGPVVTEAKAALEKGDVTPLLKWVKKDDEPVITAAFRKTLAVRSKGPEARELADQYFFETIVRIHRAGEGAAFTGLKNEPVEPIVALCDQAVAGGSDDSLVIKITGHVRKEINARFAKVVEAKKNMNSSVEAGRHYVAAYVIFMHYVEGIHSAVMGKGGHQHAEGPEAGN
jgi:hypothetical protein